MKIYILTIFLFPLILFSNKEEGKEITFFNNAVQLAKKENKILLLEFWSPTCGPCIKLKRDIFDNIENKELLNKYFLVIKMSPADSLYASLFKHFNLDTQSSVLYFDTNGNEIERTIGYDGEKESYVNFLRDVAGGHNLYKNVLVNYRKDTLNAMSNFLLAKKLSFRYQFEKANKYFNKVLMYDPEDKLGLNAECCFRIAENELIIKGRIEKLQEYIKVYAKNEFIPKAYIYIISDLKEKNDTIKCLTTCEDACMKYPENPDILNKYAWMICTFKIKKDYMKALGMIQKAIIINPNYANYYDTQAWLYYESGDREKAIQSVKKAIELNPHPVYKDELKKFLAN